MNPPALHQEKINSVVNLARHWIITMPDKPPATDESSSQEVRQRETWDGLIHLLKEFSDFTTQYARLLQQAPLNNPRFVMSRGADHLLQGFNILSRACEQRKDKTSDEGFARCLANAERMLEDYCDRWQPGESDTYVKLETPVAYFEKLYGITRAIYLPGIPIIAIPLTEYDRPENWLALSHEFGHHIFWNALARVKDFAVFQQEVQKAVGDSLSSKLNTRDVWISWLEEIFADVFGALLEGTKYAVACQDFAMERIRRPEDFVKNDHEHPPLFLRPLIVMQVLREISGQIKSNELATFLPELEQRWRAFSAPAAALDLSDPKLPVADLVADVENVVRAILNQGYWPDGKCLWDLVQYYGQSSGVSTATMGVLPLAPGRLALLPAADPAPIVEPKDEDIPDQLKEVWEYLKAQPSKKGSVPLTPEAEILAHWDILLDLGLDDSHQHDSAHASCLRHWYYWPLHKHDQLSSAVSC